MMSIKAYAVVIAILLGVSFASSISSQAGRPLPTEIETALGHLNPNTFTISGISAGACMTVQFQYAWSSIIKGAGIIAGAPYQCSGGSLEGAELCLNAPELENPQSLLADAQTNAALGLIDPLHGIANHTIVLFSGLSDTVVPQQNMDNVFYMYSELGAGKMTKYFNYSAEHAWITDKYGNGCSTLGSPYINNCGLDFAYEFFSRSFSDMKLAFNHTMSPLIPANMFSFDQTQFGADSLFNSMGSSGYMYVPTACQSTTSNITCHLHMNWHGCTQDAGNLGMEYVLFTELNEWAESNNIVIIYPQAAANALQSNPEACFDWWGYVSSTYAQKAGTQITMFRAMITKYGGF